MTECSLSLNSTCANTLISAQPGYLGLQWLLDKDLLCLRVFEAKHYMLLEFFFMKLIVGSQSQHSAKFSHVKFICQPNDSHSDAEKKTSLGKMKLFSRLDWF